jgi:acylphosphatase
MFRRTTIFTGHVQGVGFRYTTQQLARGFDLTGYVRNLPDGNVELVVEGEAPEIDRFLEALTEKMNSFIRNRRDTDSPARGEFQDFSVRH